MDTSSGRPPKIVTLEEAQALLSTVKPLVEQLQGLQRSIVQTNQQLNDLVGKLSVGNGYPIVTLKEQAKNVTAHQLDLLEAFQSALKRLEETGCLLKDVSAGLVDFYSMREGEPVFLCWKLGEERIRFWHTVDSGYDSRQPLE